jgi:hypothetical protein
MGGDVNDAEMKGREERSDPSILVNCEIGPRNNGQFSLRLVARRLRGRVAVSLEHWEQPEGAKQPCVRGVIQHFAEREMAALAWGVWSARQEIHAEGRATNKFDNGEIKPGEEE